MRFEEPGLESHLGYDVKENEKGFEIVRESGRGSYYKISVSRSTVDDVYRVLKKAGGQRTVSELESALNISNSTIYSALRILQTNGKVRLACVHGRKHRFLFEAI